ncbi:MAG TPA: HEPN domain-containing protein [Prolixibacteraceae bacterium]|nr:HEPN domain-containing protein [Prolixibacteraceae bacterium]
MKPITKEWLNAANDDLIAMEVMLGKEEITNMVAFHAQQAIEKSFKAIVEEFNLGKIRTHQLESLYAKILPFISGFNETILEELDTVYIEARYPGDLGLMPHGKPSIEEVELYYREALKIKEQVGALLSQYSPKGFNKRE